MHGWMERSERRRPRAAVLAAVLAAALPLVILGSGQAHGARAATLAVCDPILRHRLESRVLAMGEAVTAQVTVDPGCQGQRETRHLAIVLQPWTDEASARAVRDGLMAYLDGLDPYVGKIGLVRGDHAGPGGQVLEEVLRLDRQALRKLLSGFGAATEPQALDRLLAAARSGFTVEKPDRPWYGRRHVVIIGHAGAPVGREQSVAFDAEVAREDAIEVDHFCLGGGCRDVAGIRRQDVPDAAGLAAALKERYGKPALAALAWAELTLVYSPSLAYVHASAQPPVARMGYTQRRFGEPFMVWKLTGQRDPLAYRARHLPLEQGASVPALTATTLRGRTTSGEAIYASYELPEHVDTAAVPGLRSACRLRAEVTAPASVALDDPFVVLRRLAADCPGGPHKADLVLVLDRSDSMAVGGRMAVLREGVGAFLREVDLTLHRVALVGVGTRAETVLPLGQDRAALQRALRDLPVEGVTDLGAGLSEAREVLDGRRPDALPLVVLVSDGSTHFPTPSLDDPWWQAHAWLELEGISSFVACVSPASGCAQRMVSLATGADHFRIAPTAPQLEDVLLELASRLDRPSFRRLSLRQDLNGAFFGRAPSGDPSAYLHEPGASRELLNQPLMGEIHGEQRLWARAVGRWPVADRWEADWIDSDGRVGSAALPAPEVEVPAPADTGPCRLMAPSQDANPAEVAPGETTRAAFRAPVECPESLGPMELVLVLDHSESMRGERLLAMRRGVAEFLDQVGHPALRVGLVAFSDGTPVQRPLGTDRDGILDALAGLTPAGGTNIGQALNTAGGLLAAARPGAARLVFLQTDGRNSVDPASILIAADQVKQDDVTDIAALCLEADCDATLRQAVSQPGYYHELSSAAALTGFFRALAAAVDGRVPSVLSLLSQDGAALLARPESASPPLMLTEDPLMWSLGLPDPNASLAASVDMLAMMAGRQPLTLWTRVDYRRLDRAGGVLYLPPRAVAIRDAERPALPTAAPITPQVPRPSRTPPSASPTASPPATATDLSRDKIWLPVMGGHEG